MAERTESAQPEPSSSAPQPEAPPVRFRRALARGVDSALYAGALLALIDGALLLFRRGGTVSAAGLLVTLTLAACVPFGLLAGVLAWGSKRFEPERRAVRIG